MKRKRGNLMVGITISKTFWEYRKLLMCRIVFSKTQQHVFFYLRDIVQTQHSPFLKQSQMEKHNCLLTSFRYSLCHRPMSPYLLLGSFYCPFYVFFSSSSYDNNSSVCAVVLCAALHSTSLQCNFNSMKCEIAIAIDFISIIHVIQVNFEFSIVLLLLSKCAIRRPFCKITYFAATAVAVTEKENCPNDFIYLVRLIAVSNNQIDMLSSID